MCEAIEQMLIVDHGRCQFNILLELSRILLIYFTCYVLTDVSTSICVSKGMWGPEEKVHFAKVDL
jgi:hypothetical protein